MTSYEQSNVKDPVTFEETEAIQWQSYSHLLIINAEIKL